MIAFCRDVFRTLSAPCREHTALFSRALDSPLPRGVAIGLRLHTLYCTGCARFRRQIRSLHQLTGTLGQQLNAGETLPEPAKARILQRIAKSTNS